MKQHFYALFILLLITTMPSCTSETNITSIEHLKADDVASLQVLGSLPGRKGSPLIQQNDPKGKIVIHKIVEWLNSSTKVAGATEFGKHGYPMVLNLKMNDGKVIVAEPAYKCINLTNQDGRGGQKTCTPVQGEIVLSQGANRIRLSSTKVYDWLQDGWKQEING